LSGKEKVERDFRDSEACVEELAKEEIEKLKKKMNALKLETEKVGEAVDAELEETEAKTQKKKS
jgi:hypothetical protein